MPVQLTSSGMLPEVRHALFDFSSRSLFSRRRSSTHTTRRQAFQKGQLGLCPTTLQLTSLGLLPAGRHGLLDFSGQPLLLQRRHPSQPYGTIHFLTNQTTLQGKIHDAAACGFCLF